MRNRRPSFKQVAAALEFHKPLTSKWVLIHPNGALVDCAVMPKSQAMGFNQTRALHAMPSRWESFNPTVHGTWSSVVAHVNDISDNIA